MKDVYVTVSVNRKTGTVSVHRSVFTDIRKAEAIALARRGESLDVEAFVDECLLDEDDDIPAKPCGACAGSGYYDDNGSPPCGSCDGTGFEK